jgi:hypothetical protein
MTITAARVTASTSAVALNSASGAGERILITNTSANAADLGPSTVTAGTGYSLAGNATVGPLDLDANDVLYAIRSGASDATLAVLRL